MRLIHQHAIGHNYAQPLTYECLPWSWQRFIHFTGFIKHPRNEAKEANPFIWKVYITRCGRQPARARNAAGRYAQITRLVRAVYEFEPDEAGRIIADFDEVGERAQNLVLVPDDHALQRRLMGWMNMLMASVGSQYQGLITAAKASMERQSVSAGIQNPRDHARRRYRGYSSQPVLHLREQLPEGHGSATSLHPNSDGLTRNPLSRQLFISMYPSPN